MPSDRLFQSAPGVEAGRKLAISIKDLPYDEFQSAPGVEAGRKKRIADYLPELLDVSIRSRR